MANPLLRKSRWMLVRTKTGEESRADENIQNQGYGTLLPTFWKRIKHGRKEAWVTRPLFPGYIFVRVYDDQGWSPIQSTRGVTGIVTRGDGMPSHVPSDVILDMQHRMADGPLRLEVESRVRYVPGQRLSVEAGPFQGFSGLYVAAEKERVTLLLDILGRSVRMVLPDSFVAAHPL